MPPLQDLFRVVLGPANICDKEKWLSRGRIWRLFFLQAEDGYYDASPSLAFALQARKIKPTQWKREDEKGGGDKFAQAMRTAFVVVATEGEVDEAAERTAAGPNGSPVPSKSHAKGPAAGGAAAGDEAHYPCPLAGFDADAIAWSVPEALAALRVASDGAFPAERVWATALAAATMLAADESVLRKTRARDGFDETCPDGAMAWLDFIAEEFPRFAQMRQRVMEEAADHVETWAKAQDRAIAATKSAWQTVDVRTLLTKQTLEGKTLQLIRKGHETFACFLVRQGRREIGWLSRAE